MVFCLDLYLCVQAHLKRDFKLKGGHENDKNRIFGNCNR